MMEQSESSSKAMSHTLNILADPIKVLLIHHSPPLTGIGRYTLNLHRSFSEDMHVQLFDLSSTTGIFSDSQSKVRRTFALGKAAVRLPKGFDVYHISSQVISLFCAFAKPAVLTVHDLSAFSYTAGPLLSSIYKLNLSSARSACAIICPSKFVAAQISTELGIPSTKIHVVPNGVNHGVFFKRERSKCRRSIGLPDNAKVILNVSTIARHKNIPTLLRAFKIILEAEPETLLLRIGAPSPNSSSLQALAENLGVADSIIYMTPKDEELAHIYNASDVLVHTSTYEGFGLPIAEAMASGIPVVTSNAASIPEVIGDSGVMLDPFDAEGFASETLDILSNEERSQALSEKGIARSHLFTWKKCAEQTYKIYEEVADWS